MTKHDQYELITLEDLPRAEDEQFRMRQLTVYNWGTFSKIHSIPIAEDGMLLIGPSGAGKSTLLDAISVMIVPPRILHMNAAAEEGDRKRTDRSLLSYIRGAWSDRGDPDSHEMTKQYLRDRGTISAISLEYRNRLGRIVTLVRIFWMTGVSATSNVNDHYVVVDGTFSMDELLDFDGDLRKLRKKLDRENLRQHESFSSYEEHWCRIMGIDDSSALELLHRTQSTKNLGDLNRFLREFMLKEPETFERADRLVEEFGELDEAHRAVIAAREQIEVLAPARTALVEHNELSSAIETLQLQQNVRPAFESHLRAGLLDHSLQETGRELIVLRAEQAEAKVAMEVAGTEVASLERQHREAGGDSMAELERTLADREDQREERIRERDRVAQHCKALDFGVPDTPALFGDMRQKVEELARSLEDREQLRTKRRDELAVQKHIQEEELEKLRSEVLTLEGSSSNVPRELQDLRERICTSLGVSAERLVFVGELIQVRREERDWAPAAERLLGGFGRDLIVDDRHHRIVANWVERTHLGTRLVYHPVTAGRGGATREPKTSDSIFHKLELKQSAFAGWLSRELISRFDYQCVSSASELIAGDYRITKAGQVRHGGGRTEKDDRRDINDRRYWVLGFDSREKLQLYRESVATATLALAETQKALREISGQQVDDRGRISAVERLADVEWERIDVASVLMAIDGIQEQLRELRLGNRMLADLSGRLGAARVRYGEAHTRSTTLGLEIPRVEAQINSQLNDLQQAKAEAASISPNLLAAWESRLPPDWAPSLQTLSALVMGLERAVNADIGKIRARAHGLEQTITSAFGTFIRRWPEEAASLQANMDSGQDFLAKLQRIELDGLPEHEERFASLLAQQSTQRLAELASLLRDERKQIDVRLEDVNDGLLSVPYNPGSYLQIRPVDLHLQDAVEFRKRLASFFASQREPTDDPMVAEAQFRALRSLVMDLKSEDPEKRRWRARVLDVRQHVEFAAEELDRETGQQLELARGSAGKSGGQRQKLTATCLAAALRFKLGGGDGSVPMYAAVVLDEAFTKTDDEFTKTCMRIFTELGFQMIVATPIKSVMTLEEFVGGAVFVTISQRHTSSVLTIDYDNESRRLRLSDDQREDGEGVYAGA
ncbi:ATP-binding protein [Dyella sp. 20L07]|uniref:ATP-binding protein n=1 Tax=Dyella sp. 20L07 TaxID=3384240 RepID=UPI003D2CC25E